MINKNQQTLLTVVSVLLAALILIQVWAGRSAQQTAVAVQQMEAQLVGAQRSELILRQLAARVAKAGEREQVFRDILAKADIRINQGAAAASAPVKQ